ncbi:unnamed protein product [Cladocopium goreaui]|uniref:Uncharacterized protein n=1 Tax=Cladocopium goreaui TaxID=2562237 RepID=A0A9P1BHY1_9DINO|nr:unnamed protein product [Cladocopium goreaui]
MDSRATPDATVSNNATANPVALPIPLSSLLGGIVAGTSFLRLLLPATIDDVFSLVPHHTIFSPVASLPLPFLWNLLTAHLFEAGLLRAVLVVPAIVYMAERLERLWSWRSMCLYLAFCCISSSIVLLAWEVVEVFRTANEKDFFSGTRGWHAQRGFLEREVRRLYTQFEPRVQWAACDALCGASARAKPWWDDAGCRLLCSS